jgi:hypothetical protein
MINSWRNFLDCIKVDLWHETQAPFGIASHKTGEYHWNIETLKGLANGDVINRYRVKDINKVTVLETLGGDMIIIQIAGYSYNRGMFCDVI